MAFRCRCCFFKRCRGKAEITNEFKFENADYIMKNGMLVGCHPKLEQVDLDYICNSLIEFFDGR